MDLDRFLGCLATGRPGGVRVTGWSLCASASSSFSLGVKDCEIANPHAPLTLAEGSGASYRLIWEDGRVSRGHAERRQLEREPEEALSNARIAAYDDPDAAWVLGPATFPDIELCDEAAARLALGDTTSLEQRLAAIRERVERPDVRLWSGSFSAASGQSRVVTSAGLDVEGAGTTIGWHLTVNGEIGDGYSARAAEPFDEFEARIDRLLGTARLLGQEAPGFPGGSLPVLLHPHVVESYVLECLLDNLGGATVAHGEGHFRREDFGSGRPVLREDLGLDLDPLEPLRRGAYRFTSEGLPAARCTFLERGRLVQPVLDLKYARRLGLAPTPTPASMDTLRLHGCPPIGLGEALARASGSALVLSVLGVHTQDLASGDFSLSAPQCLAIGPEGLLGRARATISGNLFALLSSDDLAFVTFEGEHTPGLLVRCRIDPR